MEDTRIRATGSVQGAISRLETTPSTSWEVVKSVLKSHGEYGGSMGTKVAAAGEPTGELKSSDHWIDVVSALFDPEMVHTLHGRLFILGLAWYDENLGKHLTALEFLKPLEDELKEDFLSLLKLKDDHPEAYRNKFMTLLQNKPVENKPRTQGFVVVAKGGPGLRDLQKLSHRQIYNRPITAHYVLPRDEPLTDALHRFLSDVKALNTGQAPQGNLIPSPAAHAEEWRSLSSPLNALPDQPIPAGDVLRRVQSLDPSETNGILGIGRRLVLFLEYRRLPAGATADQLGLTADVIDSLKGLPERVGVVFSGLSDGAAAALKQGGARELELPPDRDLTRAESLSNDVPLGEDQLNIITEVNALAEALVLKDMTPPMVAGVMGGWGSGKSFVLHLLENRIQEIRCERVDFHNGETDFPFVGHPYLVRFDAWTYAKGNLWASLMQQIFTELDRQVGLEKMLQEKLKKQLGSLDATDDTEIWRVISRLSPEAQDRIRKVKGGAEALAIAAEFDRGEVSESRLWGIIEKLRSDEKDRLDKAENECGVAQAEYDKALREVEKYVDAEIERDARLGVWKAVGNEFLEQAWKKWQETNKDGDNGNPPGPSDVVETVSFYDKLLKERFTVTLALVLFALAGWLVSSVVTSDAFPQALWTGAASVFGSVFAGLARFRTWVSDAEGRFDEKTKVYREQAVATRDSRIGDLRSRARKEGTGAQSEEVKAAAVLLAKESELEKKRVEVDMRKQRIGMAARHSNLVDFVKQRLEGHFYEDKLGLLHQVKSDLEELSETLLDLDPKREMFPRGNPRIILLVDDLDRCPPDKVVEVLEAAQLLVKTRLFVVVLAMDVRYITRALEDVYQGVLIRWGEPSGLDYIEKIIQIPYRVRPVSASAIGDFLQSQMNPKQEDRKKSTDDGIKVNGQTTATDPATVPQDPGTAVEVGQTDRPPTGPDRTRLRVLPTKIQRFSQDDHELLSTCCTSFEVSPRTIKRLVNVFRLLKIIWYRRGLDEGPDPDVKQMIMALLVVAARYPDPLRELLHLMEREYATPDGKATTKIVPFLRDRCQKHGRHALIPSDWAEVEAALNNKILFPQDLTFAALQERHLRLVSTFSFIGERDPEREASLQRDLHTPLMLEKMVAAARSSPPPGDGGPPLAAKETEEKTES